MESPSAPLSESVPLWKSITVLLIAGITMMLCLSSRDVTEISKAGVIMQLPNRIGDYWGNHQEVSHAEKTILPEDTEFARKLYESSEGDQILCSIVLSGAQKRSIHRPEVCLPGQGWTVRSAEVISIPLDHHAPLRAMNLSLQRPIESGPHQKKTLSSYYLYWFVGENRMTPHHYERILSTSWDRVFHKINHRWAYVIISSWVTEGLRPPYHNASQTLTAIKEFIRLAAPTFLQPELLKATDHES